ncbi:nucleobase-ascorbate transporter 6 isoform X2 [Ziziphus jujuba]|nr:nucleobase-ascorbate transporter 6 isoform X2 [Ziziphus jujuba]
MLRPSILSHGVGWQKECWSFGLDTCWQSKGSSDFGWIHDLFSILGSGGLSFLRFCNLNSFRTKFILGFCIFLGLSVPQYFNGYTLANGYGLVHTGGRWFNDIINVPFQ